MKRKISFICLIIMSMMFLNSCQKNEVTTENQDTSKKEESVVFIGDPTPSWDSVQLHNAIISYILETGYGYRAEIISGKSNVLKETIKTGGIDVLMEYWIYDEKRYEEEIKDDLIEEASVNFSPIEGVYVPKYMIYGDEENGIKATAPGLKYLKDLPKYKDAFVTVEGEKPKLYTSAKDWTPYITLEKKYDAYGIRETFDIVIPRNDSFLANTGTSAFKEKKPWIGYYWEPSEMMALNEFVRLEEDPYSEEVYMTTGLCNFPNTKVAVVVSPNLKKEKQDVYAFLKNYKTNNDIIHEMINFNKVASGNKREFARTFLEANEDIWKNWVSKEAYKKIKNTF